MTLILLPVEVVLVEVIVMAVNMVYVCAAAEVHPL